MNVQQFCILTFFPVILVQSWKINHHKGEKENNDSL